MNNMPSVNKKTERFDISHPSEGWQNPTSDILAHLQKESPESSYFVQGGNNLNTNKLSRLDRTITYKLRNTGILAVTAVMFGTRGTPNFDPFFGASFLDLPDLGVAGQEVIRNEIVTNGFLIAGIKLKFPNGERFNLTEQQLQPLIYRTKSIIGGASSEYMYQTLNAVSPTNSNNAIIDIPEASLSIDSQTEVLYQLLPGEEVWVIYTVKKRLNSADFLFTPNPRIQTSTAPRLTGNPLADMYLLNDGTLHEPVKSPVKEPVKESLQEQGTVPVNTPNRIGIPYGDDTENACT